MPHRLRVPPCAPLPPHQTPKAMRRPVWRAMARGFGRRCPHCGKGAVLRNYLAVVDHCPCCGEQLGHIRADDGPAYFTLFAVAHIVVPVALWVEKLWAPPLVPFVAVALLATAALTWALLPSFKGATLGLMWALGLRGDERQGED